MDERQLAEAMSSVERAVDVLVAADLDETPPDLVTALVRSIARVETRLAGVTARAVGVAARSGAVERSGAATPATWLADTTGRTGGNAAASVRLGHAMESAPAVAAGVADGSLGTDNARALASALGRGILDAVEIDSLADEARHTPVGVLTREVRRRETLADQVRLRRDERWARERRSVTHTRRDDGSVEGRFRLDPVAGDLVVTALRAMATVETTSTPLELRRTRMQRDADALAEIARHALDTGAAGEELSVRPHVQVVVPVEALHPDVEDAAAAGAVGTTDDGTLLSAHAVRALLCDSSIRRIVVDPAGTPLDVGRATRSWSGAQRAASASVDGGCRGPRCDRPFAWTQLHHIDWWSRGGHTNFDRGIPLCHHCHHLVHDDGWLVEMDAATRNATWTSPGGRTLTTRPRGPATEESRRWRPPPPPARSGLDARRAPPPSGGTDDPTADLGRPEDSTWVDADMRRLPERPRPPAADSRRREITRDDVDDDARPVGTILSRAGVADDTTGADSPSRGTQQQLLPLG